MAKRDFRNERAQDDGGKKLIDSRNGGCGVMVGNKLYVWGGQTEDINEGERESQDLPRPPAQADQALILPYALDVFDMSTRTWTRQQTFSNDGTTSIPVYHGLGSSMVYDSHRHVIYLFGGWNRRRFDSNLFKLSLTNFHWKIIKPATEKKPAPRYNTEIFIHNDRLHAFGGVGVNITIDEQRIDPGAKWESAPPDGSYGWLNDHLEFSLNLKYWTSPLKKGDKRPPPLGGHRIAKFDGYRAVLFGGKGPPEHVVNERNNGAWILDLVNMKWKGPYTPLSDQPWPKPVRFFTLTPLFDPDCFDISNDYNYLRSIMMYQKLLLLWGKALYSPNTVEDCHKSTWLMEIINDEIIWTEIVIEEKPRAWHIALAYHPYPTSCPTDCEVVVFGGNKHIARDTGPRNAVSDTCIIQFGVPCLQKLCIHTITECEYADCLPPKLRQDVYNYMIATKEPVPVITVGLK